MQAQAGWYPDPSGAPQQRFFDGQDWTQAITAPTIVSVAVPVAVHDTRHWTERHPAWTALLVFWLACMLWQWPWLFPTLAAAAAIIAAVRWERRRRARLAAAADRQNTMVLRGDARGVYGDFLPAQTD